MRLARILASLALVVGVWTAQAFAAENRDGPYVEYYENGQVRYTATFRDGQLVGAWTEYWDNGQVKLTGQAEGSTFPNSVTSPRKAGTWTEYNRNGTPYLVVTYVNNTLHGPAVQYDRLGRLWREAAYENGELAGRWTEYYENGQVRQTGEVYGGWTIDRPLKTGAWVAYNRYGVLVFQGEYRSDRLHGRAVWYHLNGLPRYEANFSDGRLTGTWTEYYDNGQVRATGEAYGSAHGADSPEEPLRTGPWVEYHRSGVVAFEGTYVENKLQGRAVRYDANGLVRIEAEFDNGVLSGTWTEYYETGTVRETGEARGSELGVNAYLRPKRYGLWLRYGRDGALVEAGIYEDNWLTSTVPVESVPEELRRAGANTAGAATSGAKPASGSSAADVVRPDAAGSEAAGRVTDEPDEAEERDRPGPGGLAGFNLSGS